MGCGKTKNHSYLLRKRIECQEKYNGQEQEKVGHFFFKTSHGMAPPPVCQQVAERHRTNGRGISCLHCGETKIILIFELNNFTKTVSLLQHTF